MVFRIWITTLSVLVRKTNSSATSLNFLIKSKLKMPFYAVRRGFQPGVYLTWEECQAQVNGFKGAQFKKFATQEEAEAFKMGGTGPCSVPNNNLGRPKGSTSINTKRATSFGKAPSVSVTGSARAAPYQIKQERAAGASSTDLAPASEASLDDKRVILTDMAKCVASLRNEMAELKKQMTAHVAGKAASSASTSSSDNSAAPDQFIVDAEGFLNVWTDGACGFNGRHGARAGVGVWFNSAHPLNVSAPVEGPATNNNAEIQAAWVALELASAAGHGRVLIHTDSQFVINCATKWMAKWQKNGWTLASGGPVKNRTQLEALARAMENMEVKWNHVLGHCGVKGNEGADQLAVAGATRYNPQTASE
ncbi:Ribonuclease H1 [Amphibalanus amphitrite]|uniref:Ribonuclease H1 n=1 Tax=Amphibalanus amphitrite TaxID=1232801 RepID=A0A6A4VWT8_AMPAM|nr:Ribonuclease H1 [Amphibalanus amphitrite]